MHHDAYLLDTSKLDLNDFVSQAVLASRGDVGDIAPGPGGEHHSVLNEGVLLHCCIDVTTSQPVPSLYAQSTLCFLFLGQQHTCLPKYEQLKSCDQNYVSKH